jgi:pimeloyl-ACP methyl ester carboxylesterase
LRHILIIALALFFTLLGINTIAEKSRGDYVVVLHGIARSSDNMRSLAAFLEAQGYDTVNLDYPSTKYGLEELAELMSKELAVKLSEDKPIHFVSHSMGGLLVRVYLARYRPENLGKVVQIAPPNQGSEIADLLKDNYLYQLYYGPAGEQLTTDQTQIKNLFGEVDYPLGVIAGNRTIDPLSSAIIPNEDDGKVSISNTKLAGMSDHIVIEATHTFIANNKIAQMQVLNFLRKGEFFREK